LISQHELFTRLYSINLFIKINFFILNQIIIERDAHKIDSIKEKKQKWEKKLMTRRTKHGKTAKPIPNKLNVEG